MAGAFLACESTAGAEAVADDPALGTAGAEAPDLPADDAGAELSTRTGRTREGRGCVVSQEGTRSADRGCMGANGSTGRKAGVGGVK